MGHSASFTAAGGKNVLDKRRILFQHGAALASRTGATGAVGESLGAPSKYDGMIRQVAQETGVPAALIKAVAKQESDFDPRCSSSAGAQGLMQLMPETQRSLGVTDPYDPLQSLRGGARELRGYLEQFHGDLTLSLAAYNAGPNAVRRYGGVPPYAETQAYVRNGMSVYRRLTDAFAVSRNGQLIARGE